MDDSRERRIEDLEIRFAHQDDTIETLNGIVARQQGVIDRLERDMADLRRRLATLEAERGSDDDGGDRAEAPDTPPHY